jgi:ABC-type multidrug transport system ATPase subunit/pSer/pThr/pTyr-binding forkhead associated (FHA) protein/ABC-type transport system involved in multi-copper enzyme maturation permease subunit
MMTTVVLEISRDGETHRVSLVGGKAAIGRAEDNDIVLDDRRVSRHHARIEHRNGSYWITDLGSGNGTQRNGDEIEPKVACPLEEHDTVRVGGYTITLRSAPSDAILSDPSATIVDTHMSPMTTFVVPAVPVLNITTAEGTIEHRLTRDHYTLGRDEQSDIVVDDGKVSRTHAELRRVGNTYEIVDLGSVNGLLYQGQPIERHTLAGGDVIAIADSVTLSYRMVAEMQETGAPAQVIEVSGRTRMTIGRLTDNDIVIDHPAVSRHHARIERQNGQGDLAIEDLHSTNGTFVNGERIAAGEHRPLQSGDTVRIGMAKLIVAPESIRRVDESGELRLDALHLNQPVGKGLNLLQDISFAVLPREFVAVVGVSGAGKSTLLGALNGFRPARRGAVLVNGDDLYRNFDAFRTNLGYVPQDDIIHMDLPVQRALQYAAKLRLPADMSNAERGARVVDVMDTLGLSDRAQVPVRNLSGGQRKRVSMGVELLTKPGLFFLDEATSGLDPGTELQMMRLLRRLADDGHTILLITHATKNVVLCDQAVFLARGGHLAWYGPPEAALTYFGVSEFDAIYEKLESERAPEEWAERYRASPEYQTYVLGRLEEHYGPELQPSRPRPEAAEATPKPAGGAARRISSLGQFRVLAARHLDILRRDRASLILLVLVPILLGAIDLLAWPRNILDPVTGNPDRTMTMLFLATINAFLVGGLSSVREIVKESAIYQRERMVTVKVLPYLLSKTSVALIFSIYTAAVFLGFKLLAVDMSSAGAEGIVQLYVTLLLATLSGAIVGLLLSALARREEQVMMLVVIVVVVQIVFSGGVLPLGNLGPAGQVFGSITSSKWVFQAEVAALQVKTGDCESPSLEDCNLPGIRRFDTAAERRVLLDQLDERFGDVFGANVYTCWAALVAILAATFVALAVVQKRKDVAR